MRWYLTEAFRGVRSRPGFALILILVTAGLTGTALWYANGERSQARDEASAVEVDGWYLVVFADQSGEPLSSGNLAALCGLEPVAWAVGVLPAEDYVAGPADRIATLRGLRGCNLDRIGVPVEADRLYAPVGLIETFPFGPQPGDQTAAFGGTQGTVQVLQWDPLPLSLIGGSAREGYLVLPADPAARDILTVRVGVRTLEAATELADIGPEVLRGPAAASIRVQPTRAQYEAQRTYLAGLDRSSALAVVAIVGVAAAVSAGMLLITTRLRAREYARRRTLGCRRLPLVALVMVEVMTTTALGAATGLVAFLAASRFGPQAVLPATVLVSLPAILIGATGLLSVPVAIWVGAKDPVVVLRVP